MNEPDRIYSSHFYDFKIRGTTNDRVAVNIYTDRNRFSVKKNISFDVENKDLTSLEYFSGSVLSSILLALIEYFQKNKIVLQELEGVAEIVLANPLTLLGVQEYTDEPFIDKMAVKIYISLDLEADEAYGHCQRALKYSPLVNTLKKSMKLEVNFKIMDY